MYTEAIRKLDSSVNPVGVECCMRLQYGTLDHLRRDDFLQEIALAKACEVAKPGFLRELADSYGRAEDFDRAEGAVRSARASPRLAQRWAVLDDAALRKAGRAAGNAAYQARRDLKDMPAGDSGRAAAAAKLAAASASRKEIATEASRRGLSLSPTRGRAKEQGAER